MHYGPQAQVVNVKFALTFGQDDIFAIEAFNEHGVSKPSKPVPLRAGR